jgi:hypothetical protein
MTFRGHSSCGGSSEARRCGQSASHCRCRGQRGHHSDSGIGKEIAWRLGLSVKTVESHQIRLMRKLDIHETATLVRYAIRRGLTPP